MGPRSDDRGKHCEGAYPKTEDIASMGPRSDDRGKHATFLAARPPSRQASMGPRSDDRGKFPYRVQVPPTSLKLQWGRGRMTAESTLASERLQDPEPASMGPRSDDRGKKPRFRKRRRISWCFNGAAVG